MGPLELPKYNENRVFAAESLECPGRTEQHFRKLDPKFATPRINRIFGRINELKPLEQPNNNGNFEFDKSCICTTRKAQRTARGLSAQPT